VLGRHRPADLATRVRHERLAEIQPGPLVALVGWQERAGAGEERVAGRSVDQLAGRAAPAGHDDEPLAQEPRPGHAVALRLRERLPAPERFGEGRERVVGELGDVPEPLLEAHFIRRRRDAQRIAQQRDGLANCTGAFGEGGGAGERGDGLGRIVFGEPARRMKDRLAVVVRDELGPGLVERLEPAREREVRGRALAAGERAVRDVADDDVSERVAAVGLRDEQVALGEGLEPAVGRRAEELLRRRGRDRAAGHRAELEDPALARGQEVEPGEHRRLDRVRQLHVVAVVAEAARELGGEERVALGPIGDARPGRTVGVGQERADERCGRRRRRAARARSRSRSAARPPTSPAGRRAPAG